MPKPAGCALIFLRFERKRVRTCDHWNSCIRFSTKTGCESSRDISSPVILASRTRYSYPRWDRRYSTYMPSHPLTSPPAPIVVLKSKRATHILGNCWTINNGFPYEVPAGRVGPGGFVLYTTNTGKSTSRSGSTSSNPCEAIPAGAHPPRILPYGRYPYPYFPEKSPADPRLARSQDAQFRAETVRSRSRPALR